MLRTIGLLSLLVGCVHTANPEKLLGTWKTACHEPKASSKYFFQITKTITQERIATSFVWSTSQSCEQASIRNDVIESYSSSFLPDGAIAVKTSLLKEGLEMQDKNTAEQFKKTHPTIATEQPIKDIVNVFRLSDDGLLHTSKNLETGQSTKDAVFLNDQASIYRRD